MKQLRALRRCKERKVKKLELAPVRGQWRDVLEGGGALRLVLLPGDEHEPKLTPEQLEYAKAKAADPARRDLNELCDRD